MIVIHSPSKSNVFVARVSDVGNPRLNGFPAVVVYGFALESSGDVPVRVTDVSASLVVGESRHEGKLVEAPVTPGPNGVPILQVGIGAQFAMLMNWNDAGNIVRNRTEINGKLSCSGLFVFRLRREQILAASDLSLTITDNAGGQVETKFAIPSNAKDQFENGRVVVWTR